MNDISYMGKLLRKTAWQKSKGALYAWLALFTDHASYCAEKEKVEKFIKEVEE
jgi:hypothetical protein